MIPLGIIASAHVPSATAGPVFTDSFASTTLDPGYWVGSYIRPLPAGTVGGGRLIFAAPEGVSSVIHTTNRLADGSATVRCETHTQIRRRWQIHLNAQIGANFGEDMETRGGFIYFSGYTLQVANDDPAGAGRIVLRRNGVHAAAANPPHSMPPGNFHLKIVKDGSWVRCRRWLVSGTEPSTWDIEYQDPDPLPAGYAGLGASNTGNRQVAYLAPFIIST